MEARHIFAGAIIAFIVVVIGVPTRYATTAEQRLPAAREAWSPDNSRTRIAFRFADFGRHSHK